MDPRKILFLAREEGIWVDQDRDFLSRHFSVSFRKVTLRLNDALSLFLEIPRYQMIFAWFGSLPLFPFLFWAAVWRKKIIVISGGFDVAKLPEIRHGAFMQSSVSKFFRRQLFACADLILNVSESNRKEALQQLAGLPRDRFVLLPLSVPALGDSFAIKDFSERKTDVLMIASANEKQESVKGLDQFLKLVQACPEWKFVHVGQLANTEVGRALRECNNLSLKGYVPYGSAEFIAILSDAKVVVQLSRYESFCSSLVETASLGAYPIVFDRYALRELVSEMGELVAFGEVDKLIEKIQSVLLHPVHAPVKIAEHFRAKYDPSVREKKLIEICRKIFAAK